MIIFLYLIANLRILPIESKLLPLGKLLLQEILFYIVCASVGIGHCPIPSIGLLDFGPNGLSPLQLQFQMDYNFVILVKFPLILAKIIIPAQIKPYGNLFLRLYYKLIIDNPFQLLINVLIPFL